VKRERERERLSIHYSNVASFPLSKSAIATHRFCPQTCFFQFFIYFFFFIITLLYIYIYIERERERGSANHKTLCTIDIPSIIHSCCKNHTSTTNIQKRRREFQICIGFLNSHCFTQWWAWVHRVSKQLPFSHLKRFQLPTYQSSRSFHLFLYSQFHPCLKFFSKLIIIALLCAIHHAPEPHFRFQRIFFQTELFSQRSIPYQIPSWLLLQSCSTKSSGYVNANAHCKYC
jgi:hypothetical protein